MIAKVCRRKSNYNYRKIQLRYDAAAPTITELCVSKITVIPYVPLGTLFSNLLLTHLGSS
ncbi:hypothetical protein J2T14_000345 [Paenibacillus harenae]|nr:hypothetical protein [Paenibacillus harenae]